MTKPALPSDFDVENGFAQAMKNGQLTLNYQPIVDLKDGHVRGFEALMRWNHPEHGFIGPSVFIPVAIKSGLIIAASKWALKEACRALKRIEGRIGQVKNLYMSVNFTASDFAEDSFLEDLYQIISVSDVLPTQIQLEITEELLMSQPEEALKTLGLCRKAGLKIAVDDFGTGTASINFLQSFPIDTVKLDRVFLRSLMTDEAKREEAKPVLAIGQTRNLIITAEGIEEKDEALLMKDLGCNTAQGYYFAKPMPEKEVVDLLLEMNGFSSKLAAA
jgi:EAL domain-containing protein (putative c-di-GMP-specific phosphodiesterase class I)